MPIATFDLSADIDTIVSALRRDGAVIVRNLVDTEIVDAVRAELRPELDASGLATESDFNGSKTLRVSNVLAVAPSAAAPARTIPSRKIGNSRRWGAVMPQYSADAANPSVSAGPFEGRETAGTIRSYADSRQVGPRCRVTVPWRRSGRAAAPGFDLA